MIGPVVVYRSRTLSVPIEQIDHHRSHRELLSRRSPEGSPYVDAIVVPATRPAEHIRASIELGVALQAPVVVLTSGQTDADAAAALADDLRCGDFVVVDMTDVVPREMPPLMTSDIKWAAQGRLHDLSIKRNVGLLLGRMLGWGRLLFLDDDVYGFDVRTVANAARYVGPNVAVGMPALHYPDNSVVCHAQRVGGHYGDQGVFVSGSALIVDCENADSFFPDIYDEDWLFLAPHIASESVAAVGAVRQREYLPFANPRRAELQEFGDVLAEGLMALLHVLPTSDKFPEDVPVSYWYHFLLRRQEFTQGAIDRIESTGRRSDKEKRDALECLVAAEEARRKISPDALAYYLDAWRTDLATWRDHLGRLPTVAHVGDALDHLGLPVVRVAHARNRVLRLPAGLDHGDGEAEVDASCA